MSEFLSRIRKKVCTGSVVEPEDTVRFFKNGMDLGWSGFTPVGYPKVVPPWRLPIMWRRTICRGRCLQPFYQRLYRPGGGRPLGFSADDRQTLALPDGQGHPETGQRQYGAQDGPAQYDPCAGGAFAG